MSSPGAEPAGRVADLAARVLEVVVLAAAARLAARRLGELAVPPLKFMQGVGARLAVDVEHEQAGLAAGADRDAGVRVALPPCADQRPRSVVGVLQAAFACSGTLSRVPGTPAS